MILYEFEGKNLLKAAGVNIPNSQLLHSLEDRVTLVFPLVLKAQVLSGKRAEQGGIVFANNENELVDNLEMLFGKTVNKEVVEIILAEEKTEIEKEYYVSISYDTETRGPVLTISESGGTGIEERKANTYSINPLNLDIISDQNQLFGLPQELIAQLIKLFFDTDFLLLEINPLVKTKTGEWIALDAKIKLDDAATSRHEDWKYPPRLVAGYTPTEREILAKKIDEGDHRGTAGSTYFDLPGDIAVLASGGGGSLTAMDVLLKAGGKPANYTEYSGNPPKEKVIKLAKIVLSKPNINGLWIIGTVAANFTDVHNFFKSSPRTAVFLFQFRPRKVAVLPKLFYTFRSPLFRDFRFVGGFIAIPTDFILIYNAS